MPLHSATSGSNFSGRLFNFTVCVTYLSFPLYFSPGGDTGSQNGGEDVTSRQHDRGRGHGPPRTPV